MKNLLILCGGKSAEHEVSIVSAQNVIHALDKDKYQPIVVLISRSGSWYYLHDLSMLWEIKEVTDSPAIGTFCSLMRQPQQTLLTILGEKPLPIDAAFPLIHGPMGEDGTLQGLLELMNLPYVGSNVLASAMAMDKDTLKTHLMLNKIPVVPYICLHDKSSVPSFKTVCHQLETSIVFVKSAGMGSSVGVYKVASEDQYIDAIEQAFQFSFKVLLEKYVPGRELECSVLGNHDLFVSCVGEVKSNHDFYSYEAKYLDPNGADLIIPAPLDNSIQKEIQALAIQAFKVIGCKGMARVDFFISNDNKIYVNEINTIPGFTEISMYPKLLIASGVSYQTLINKLIDLADENFQEKQMLSYKPELSLNVEISSKKIA